MGPREAGKWKPSREKKVVWLGLAGKAVLLSTVFLVSLQSALAGNTRLSDPRSALRIVPGDAIAGAELARRLAETNEARHREPARDLAMRALARSPLLPSSLWALATVAENETGASIDPTAAMRAAETLSLRDVGVQLWLAQRAIRRGRIEESVDRFDTALKTSISGRSLLFPALASAARDARVRQALVRRLRQRPSWRDMFTGFLVDDNLDKVASAAILTQYLDAANENDRANARSLIFRLGQVGEFEKAWRVMSQFGFADVYGSQSALVAPSFEQFAGVAPFAWQLFDQSEAWAEIIPRPDGKGSALLVNGKSARETEVATQTVRLEPGRYRLSATAGTAGGQGGDIPKTVVRCASDQKSLMIGSLKYTPKVQPAAVTRMTDSFIVPADCPYQTVTVVVGRTAEPGPWIDDIAITAE